MVFWWHHGRGWRRRGTCRAMRYSPPRRRAQSSPRATGRFGVFSTISAFSIAMTLLVPTAASAVQPPVSASWHGREIQAPQRQGEAIRTAALRPAERSSASVRLGTGFSHPGGSQRVREVQRRLWRPGYRPGPVDGLFGPRTRASTQWFQIKHGLTPDGVVGVLTLAVLRERTGAAPAAQPVRAPVGAERTAGGGAVPQAQRAARPAGRTPKPAGGGVPRVLAALLVVVLAAFALIAVPRRRRGTPKTRRPARDPEVAAGPAPQRPAGAN